MNSSQGIQLFVLDISVIVLAGIVLLLSLAVYNLHRKSQEQQKYNDTMEKTIDRILKIDAGAGGGIDGWEMTRQESKLTKTTKK